MLDSEIEVLTRAHRLLSGTTQEATPDAGDGYYDRLLARTAELNTVGRHQHYQQAVTRSRAMLASTGRADADAARIVAAAHHDHAVARERTGHVVQEARADTADTPDTPLAQRELMRRRAARLRAQRGHLFAVQQRAHRHRHALRRLRYPAVRHPGRRLPPPNTRAALAVRAALSRLGRPYLWGASGPNRFDCSGLTQWSYAQAGIHLDRTTYQQIHQGIAVPRGYVRPGDLVFPHPGHVQLAIGNNLVVEAPHPGASVRISPLGAQVQIRRPT